MAELYNRNSPCPIAHRGCMEAGPENSHTAFEAAVTLGAGGVEIDVRKTRDGKPVVFHDADVRRLTMGWQGPYCNSKIKDMTWEHISQIRLPFGGHLLKRFPDEGYADEKQYYYPWAAASEQDVLYQMGRLESRSKSEEQLTLAIYRCYKEEYEKLCLEDGRLEQILSLQEFFKWLQTQPDGFFAEVELKERGIAGAVIQMAEKYHVEERCIIFSGIEDVIWEIQDWCKNHGKPDRLRLGANIRYLREEQKEMLERGDFYEVGLNAGAFESSDVEYLHQRGIRVFSNLGDTPVWWETLECLGVDGFKTNCLGAYRKWRQKWEQR